MSAKVLMIDDSKLFHAMLDDGLSGEGLEHLHAFDADQGFWLAKRAEPDLILLDVVMPKTSGFDLCQTLKGDPQTAQIPVIFLSGVSDTFNKVQGLDLGAIDYITKPFETADLQARVRAALRTKRLVDMLADTAQIDALTGLRNRQHFESRLAEELSATRRFGRWVSLILLDIDHFKRCNDSFGHPFGDRVLQAVAETLQKAGRPTDSVCRYGGEEFAVIASESPLDGAADFAERLRGEIEGLVLHCRGEKVSITLSAGVASTTQLPDCRTAQPEWIVLGADEALYRAKRLGRNRVEAALAEVMTAGQLGTNDQTAQADPPPASLKAPAAEVRPIWEEAALF